MRWFAQSSSVVYNDEASFRLELCVYNSSGADRSNQYLSFSVERAKASYQPHGRKSTFESVSEVVRHEFAALESFPTCSRSVAIHEASRK